LVLWGGKRNGLGGMKQEKPKKEPQKKKTSTKGGAWKPEREKKYVGGKERSVLGIGDRESVPAPFKKNKAVGGPTQNKTPVFFLLC